MMKNNRWLIRSMIKVVVLMAMLVSVTVHGETESEEHGHKVHKNLIGVFLGLTSENRRDVAPSFGIEYEQRLSDSFGIGLLAEHAFGDADFNIYAVPFAWHLDQWKLYAAPGIENSDAHGNDFLFRVGVQYGFEVRRYEIAPQLALDFVGGDRVYVAGITFARGF